MEQNEIKELQDYFDNRYVSQKDCNEIVNETNEKMGNMRVGFSEINTKLNMIIGIFGVICVPVVSIAIKLLFD